MKDFITTNVTLDKTVLAPLFANKKRAIANEAAFKLQLLFYACVLYDNGNGLLISDLDDDDLRLVAATLVANTIKMTDEEQDTKMAALCARLQKIGFSVSDLEDLMVSELLNR